MADEPDDFFSDMTAEAAEAPKTTKASLDVIHSMGVEAAELETRIKKGEALLNQLKIKRYDLLSKQMPATMDELRVPNITIDGFYLEVKSHYKASIAADDPPEQRDKAFEWVESAGGGDIINNVVTVAFPKEQAADAAEFAEEVAKRFHNQQGITVAREKTVPWNRLTSWLKAYVESKPIPGKPKLAIPLDVLNASIGRVVKIKQVDEE